MLDAASERAQEVIASAEVTVVLADFFGALWEALDEPPQPNARLARAFKEARKGPRKTIDEIEQKLGIRRKKKP